MSRLTPAVMRALDILELLAEDPPRRSMMGITKATGIPHSSAHELIATLEHRGFLERDADGMLSLGPGALRLGNAYATRFDLLDVATRVARDTAVESGATCSIALLQGSDVYYLAKEDGLDTMRLPSSVGRRVPAHATALGKALLARMDVDEVRGILPDELATFTPRTITDRDALERELAEIRRRGWALEWEESGFDTVCVALPIADQRDQSVAAVSISMPIVRWSSQPEAEWVAVVGKAAASISRRLGGAGFDRRQA